MTSMRAGWPKHAGKKEKNPWPWPAAINDEKFKKKKKKNMSRLWNRRTDSWLCLCCLPKVINVNISHFSLHLCFFSRPLSPSLSYLFFPPQCMTWLAAARGPTQLCNFIRVYFAGIFLSVFFPPPWYYFALPLQQYHSLLIFLMQAVPWAANQKDSQDPS